MSLPTNILKDIPSHSQTIYKLLGSVFHEVSSSCLAQHSLLPPLTLIIHLLLGIDGQTLADPWVYHVLFHFCVFHILSLVLQIVVSYFSSWLCSYLRLSPSELRLFHPPFQTSPGLSYMSLKCIGLICLAFMYHNPVVVAFKVYLFQNTG